MKKSKKDKFIRKIKKEIQKYYFPDNDFIGSNINHYLEAKKMTMLLAYKLNSDIVQADLIKHFPRYHKSSISRSIASIEFSIQTCPDTKDRFSKLQKHIKRKLKIS